MTDHANELFLGFHPPIATITINCPEDMNRLNPISLVQLGEMVATLRKRDDIQAVVITGSGDDWFSAGLMNAEIRAGMTKDDVIDYVVNANRILDDLESLPQITIAAINGKIMAGAAEVARPVTSGSPVNIRPWCFPKHVGVVFPVRAPPIVCPWLWDTPMRLS